MSIFKTCILLLNIRDMTQRLELVWPVPTHLVWITAVTHLPALFPPVSIYLFNNAKNENNEKNIYTDTTYLLQGNIDVRFRALRRLLRSPYRRQLYHRYLLPNG